MANHAAFASASESVVGEAMMEGPARRTLIGTACAGDTTSADEEKVKAESMVAVINSNADFEEA